jgi:hypothetical protein
MTEHYDKVNQRQLEIEAEKWGGTVTMIESTQGRVDTWYNSGRRVRKYHRDFDEHKKGDVIVLEKGMSLSEKIDEMGRPKDGFTTHYK